MHLVTVALPARPATPLVSMTSLRFIRCFRRLLRNHERLAGFRLNPSTWSRGPTPLSGVQGRLSSAQSRANGAQGRLFSGNYSRFCVDVSSGDLLFFQDHGLVSGEKAALLVQFGQADAGGLVFVVFQRLETWPSRLAAFLGMRAAGVEGAAAGRVERRRWVSG